MRKTITKRLESLKQAEHFQDRLYNKYWSVELVRFPECSEKGIYQWTVTEN